MADFIWTPASIIRTPRRPVIRSAFENGEEQVRSRWTKTKYDFELHFNNIEADVLLDIEDFFDEQKGGQTSFTINIVEDGVDKEYTVRFLEDEIQSEMVDNEVYNAVIKLRQI
jgi:hypothetical protein